MELVADERIKKISDLACEHLEISPDELSASSLFVEEHGADSLALIDLLAAVEREFDVVIDTEELPRMTNVRGVYEVVARIAGWEPAAQR